MCVHLFDHSLVERATRHVGLIGDQHQGEPGSPQSSQRLGHARDDFQLAKRVRRTRYAGANRGSDQGAIAIEKHRRARPFSQSVLSHLVGAVLS